GISGEVKGPFYSLQVHKPRQNALGMLRHTSCLILGLFVLRVGWFFTLRQPQRSSNSDRLNAFTVVCDYAGYSVPEKVFALASCNKMDASLVALARTVADNGLLMSSLLNLFKLF
ncbi:hypothetical protein M8C21_024569, partial [Ambrosia artemisiifolia]